MANQGISPKKKEKGRRGEIETLCVGGKKRLKGNRSRARKKNGGGGFTSIHFIDKPGILKEKKMGARNN